MSARRNITVQVLPVSNGAHASVLGNFIVLHLEDGSDVGYVEQGNGDLYAEGADATRYVQVFAGLRAEALSPVESVKFIDAVLTKGKSWD